MASSFFFCTPPAHSAADVWRGACACSDVQEAHEFAKARGFDFGDLLRIRATSPDLLHVFDEARVRLKRLEIVTEMCDAMRPKALRCKRTAKDYLVWMAALDAAIVDCRAMQERIAAAIRDTIRLKD